MARTAVAKKTTPSTAITVVNYEAEIAAMSARLQAPSGDKIRPLGAKRFALPDKSEHETINAIVVDFVAVNRYYDGPYNPDESSPPSCFAIGFEPSGMTPSDNSPKKQGGACASCWANQFGTAQTGKGKACSNTRLLALIIPPAELSVNDDLSELPLYVLGVSPTALTAFDSYVNKIATHFKKPVRTVLTQLSFAQDLAYASLRFAAVRPLEPVLEQLANARLDEARKRLFIEPDISVVVEASPPRKPAQQRPIGRAAGNARK